VSKLAGSALRRWQRDCAMIFQQFNLVPRLDVLTNVLLGRLNHRSTMSNLLSLFTREERAMAISALERLDIAERAVLQSAEAHRIVTRKYAGGIATVVELFDAVAAETGSRLAFEQGRFDVVTAVAARRQARGLDISPLEELDR